MFAVTIGGVIGPNLASPTARWATSLGMPDFAGPFLVSLALLLLCALLVAILLRPDPLVVARAASLPDESARSSDVASSSGDVASIGIGRAIGLIWSDPGGRVGLLAVMGAHATMVAVMVMTPVHIQHAGHGLQVVGVVISGHVVGMYALSPVMGWLTDARGPRTTVGAGAAILLAACAVSGTADDHQAVLLGVGLFLLGLGWSACIVGGSVLVSRTSGDRHRPAVQGAGDLLMGLSAAVFASASGMIAAELSYAALCLIAAILVVPMVIELARRTPLAAVSRGKDEAD